MTEFRILVVCTGNIARSPMAQRLLQHALADRPEFVVSSAGTWGFEGSPMEPDAATALAELGIDDGGFRARELTEAMVSQSDLVLTASREHRGSVLGLAPTALRRTFTLREFARLADLVAAELPDLSAGDRPKALVRAAGSARGSVYVKPHEDDIEDPYRAPLEVYRARRDEIAAATATIAVALTGTSPA